MEQYEIWIDLTEAEMYSLVGFLMAQLNITKHLPGDTASTVSALTKILEDCRKYVDPNEWLGLEKQLSTVSEAIENLPIHERQDLRDALGESMEEIKNRISNQ